MNLDELRKQIDGLDEQILELLNKRADWVHEIGLIKKQSGAGIYAPEREEQLLRGLLAKSRGRLPEKSIRAIYREIMSASLALEKELSIAYLGPEGTWSHQAAREKFGASVNYSPQPTIAGVFAEVERGRADYGVVPIENSTEGAVNYTLDVFMDSELRICAQVLLRIENNLIGRGDRKQIKKVYSHPQVFGQCRMWLQQNLHGVELVEVSSTTRAAEMAAGEAGAAALAGKLAAELCGLTILEPSVQDNPNNTTRFLVIGQRSAPPTGNDKTSLMFTVKDEPGTLFSALEPFKNLKINLSKIESRPSKKKAWEYVFFLDVSGHREDPILRDALAQVGKHCSMVKILGSYPAGETGA